MNERAASSIPQKVLFRPTEKARKNEFQWAIAAVILFAFMLFSFAHPEVRSNLGLGRNHSLKLAFILLWVVGLGVGVALAYLGIDKLFRPASEWITNQPDIELIDDGIRYHYKSNFADVKFADIVEVLDGASDGGPTLVLKMRDGLSHEIAGYEQMERIKLHLTNGVGASSVG